MLDVIGKINFGYSELEPTIIGLMAAELSFMLIGRHGTGKTRLARCLSTAFGEDGFGFFDATKDDLITVAGIPDPDAIKNGRLDFVKHKRSIWDKEVIVIDEITRAGKESQNLWLEILEERTCFGKPLSYRSLIATANPESYAAAFQLDEALLDRFYAVVPVPEMQHDTSSADIRKMVALATRPQGDMDVDAMRKVFEEIRTVYKTMVESDSMTKISRYLEKLVPTLLRSQHESETFVSPRTYSRNLPLAIAAIAAYYEVAGVDHALVLGAQDALKFGIATKLQIKTALVQQLHASAAGLLSSGEIPKADELRFKLSALESFDKRLAFCASNWQDIRNSMQQDEQEKLLGKLLSEGLEKGKCYRLIALKEMLLKVSYTGEVRRQLDGRLLVLLNSAAHKLLPIFESITSGDHSPVKERAAASAQWLSKSVRSGQFSNDDRAEVLKFKSAILRWHEDDDLQSKHGDMLKSLASLKLDEIK